MVPTQRAADIFNPETADGTKRGANVVQVAVWGTEVETVIADLEARVASFGPNPFLDWIELHSA